VLRFTSIGGSVANGANRSSANRRRALRRTCGLIQFRVPPSVFLQQKYAVGTILNGIRRHDDITLMNGA